MTLLTPHSNTRTRPHPELVEKDTFRPDPSRIGQLVDVEDGFSRGSEPCGPCWVARPTSYELCLDRPVRRRTPFVDSLRVNPLTFESSGVSVEDPFLFFGSGTCGVVDV